MTRWLSSKGLLALFLVQTLVQVSYGQGNSILFQREGDPSLYSINPDGSNLMVVAEGYEPVRSPDGQLILVNDLHGTIKSISSDGRTSVQLEGGGHYSWSPDGERFAFQRGGGIYVINKDGSGERLLADDRCWRPFWSPVDPLVVYYNRTRPTSMDATDLFLVNVATGESKLVRKLTFIPEILSYPFSPDGTRVFISESGREGIKVMNLVTGELVQIGPSGERVGAQRPAWSPDGNYIAFEVGDGMGGLYVADSEGKTVTMLVPGRGEAAPGGAAWSPSGDMIAFHMRDWIGGQQPQLYVINVDGTRMRKLTEGSWPVWASMPSRTQKETTGSESLIQPQSWGKVKRETR